VLPGGDCWAACPVCRHPAAIREVSSQTDWLTTPAGTGTTTGPLGDGGPAAQATLNDPTSAIWDGAGNLVLADAVNNRIRVVAASTGTFYGQTMTAGDVYTVAGTGAQGFSGDGGPGTSAEVDEPSDVTVTGAGSLLLADAGNGRIRMLTG
jgi:hypothetical protein